MTLLDRILTSLDIYAYVLLILLFFIVNLILSILIKLTRLNIHPLQKSISHLKKIKRKTNLALRMLSNQKTNIRIQRFYLKQIVYAVKCSRRGINRYIFDDVQINDKVNVASEKLKIIVETVKSAARMIAMGHTEEFKNELSSILVMADEIKEVLHAIVEDDQKDVIVNF